MHLFSEKSTSNQHHDDTDRGGRTTVTSLVNNTLERNKNNYYNEH
jgi:hypothetical protein